MINEQDFGKLFIKKTISMDIGAISYMGQRYIDLRPALTDGYEIISAKLSVVPINGLAFTSTVISSATPYIRIMNIDPNNNIDASSIAIDVYLIKEIN